MGVSFSKVFAGDSQVKAIYLGDSEVYSIENNNTDIETMLVKAYLQNAVYPNNDYSYSIVQQYYGQSVSYRKDQPRAIELNLPDSLGGVVDISYVSDFSKVITSINVASGVSLLNIYNLIPCKVYYRYKRNGNTISIGNFDVTGNLRMLNIDSTANVRDLGGWSSSLGGKVSYGKIIRGEELLGNVNHITQQDIDLMRSDLIGIKAEIDFRNTYDINPLPTESALGSDIDYYIGADYDIGSYLSFLETGDEVKNCFLAVLASLTNNKPVYIHCKVGCDRTGCFSLFLLGLLGVSESNIANDYELSSFAADYGVGTGGRRRNYGLTEYGVLYKETVAAIKENYTGETLNDKIYNLALSFGITRQQISSFRNYMLN